MTNECLHFLPLHRLYAALSTNATRLFTTLPMSDLLHMIFIRFAARDDRDFR